MKRIAWFLVIVSGFLTLVFGLAWVNNFYLSFIKLIWRQKAEVAETIKGLSWFFDALCIDHSTMTTLIPFMGFGFITIGLGRLLKESSNKKTFWQSKHFPFYAGHNEFVIVLGLIGTVWGLIMIGYYPDLERVGVKELVHSLHTALWSTLVALLWVFLFATAIVKPATTWLVKKMYGLSSLPSRLPDAVESARGNLIRFNAVLNEATARFEKIKEKVPLDIFETLKKAVEINSDAVVKIKEKLESYDTRLLPFISKLDQLERLGPMQMAFVELAEKAEKIKTSNESLAANAKLQVSHLKIIADSISREAHALETRRDFVQKLQTIIASALDKEKS